jgi:putative restriction endonuclease
MARCRVERVDQKYGKVICLVCDGKRGVLHVPSNDGHLREFGRGQLIAVRVSSYDGKYYQLSLPPKTDESSAPERLGAEFLDLEPVPKSVKEQAARSSAFRALVMQHYSGVCVVCGDDTTVGYDWFAEAAHIVPKYKRGADNLQNALCLCPAHHWAFDRLHIGIDSTKVVRVASHLQGLDLPPIIQDFKDAPAHFPKDLSPPIGALMFHFEKIFLRRGSQD